MTIAKAIARAWTDAAYKSKLLSNPHAALAEAGIDVPEGVDVKIVEDTAGARHIVLPLAPENANELPTEVLEMVAGGASPTKINGQVTD